MEEDNRPQVNLDVDYENGMGVSIGRLREDSMFDYKFVGLSHNTVKRSSRWSCALRRSTDRQGIHFRRNNDTRAKQSECHRMLAHKWL